VPEFLVDENLPRSLAPRLRAAGFQARDVRDLGLRGLPDAEIFEFARTHELVLLTSDLGFGLMLRSKPDSPGVILARLPNEWSTWAVNELLEKSLGNFPDYAPGTLIVVEPERIRIRRFL
jgi:predicted nuclease of predicted toxin-antitoxin system